MFTFSFPRLLIMLIVALSFGHAILRFVDGVQAFGLRNLPKNWRDYFFYRLWYGWIEAPLYRPLAFVVVVLAVSSPIQSVCAFYWPPFGN